jgi:outer membrane receptor protein involved in Fe transport
MYRYVLRALLAAALLVPASLASAQSATGTISGRVVDDQGLGMPGVTVTAKSPSLQGVRSSVTSENGDYLMPLLPPGDYTVSFELSGFGTQIERRSVAATQPVTIDATMKPASVSEVVTVTAQTDIFLNTVQSAANIKAETLATLPTARTMLAAVDLSPAVHATGPSGNRTISGAMSFENVFLVNGVQVTDNVRNTPFNLFIEDAIQEVTTTTSGISAEYGRFNGGVVNAITKSGGNTFAGSFRTTFTNDNWRTTTPFGEPKTSKVVPAYEFTGGGPILKDRTWYFGAGRLKNDSITRTLAFTNIPFENGDNEKRFEGKVTQSLGAGHSVNVAYTNIKRDQTNNAFPNAAGIMDTRSLVNRGLPQNFLSVHYSGTVSPRFFLEGQVSSRHFTFDHDGATTTDRIQGTTLVDRQRSNQRYWSPTFCGVCPGEQRDNTEVLAKGHYFLSTGRGAHDIVFGYDTFDDKRLANNHQSGSDYTVTGTTSIIQGDTIYPVFAADTTTSLAWQPIFRESDGTHFRTHAVFVQDTLRYNDRLTFNLGVRYDKNHGKDSVGHLTANDSAFSPRLGVVWDPKGDGKWGVTASYATYVAGIANSIGDAGSPGGRAANFQWNYAGPPINTNASGPLVPADQALTQLFAWFDSVGGANLRPYRTNPTLPGVSTQIQGSLKSPHVNEIAAGLSRQLSARASVRTDVTYRNFADFYATRTDLSTGKVTSETGQTFDLSLIENTDTLKRKYAAFTSQASYRFGDRAQISGNYTLSRLWGTVNGENIGSGPVTSGILQFPEYTDESWNSPEGDLAADQRHRFLLFGHYRLPISERVGSLTVSGIERIQSGTPYGASGTVDTRPFVTNPGYTTPPATVTYFFTARDAFHTETQVRTDFAVNYSYRFAGRHELFAQAQLLNAFNQFQLIDVQGGNINTSVLTNTTNASQYSSFNAFTATPTRGVNWELGPQFGQALGKDAYTLPRTFQFALGIRF